jgi:hypothetical protein
MAEISPHDRQLALDELEKISGTLSAMSAWVDDDSPERERCSIALEDAAKSVMVGAYLLERAGRLRVADLAHRRMSQQGADGQQGR